MVKATEIFAQSTGKLRGLRIIRKWATAEEVFTPVGSYESKGVGLYRVAFSVADEVSGATVDVRPRLTESGYFARLVVKLGDVLRRLIR